jgi:hypothetical protein
VNPELRASNDHFLKWGFREHGITQAALSVSRSGGAVGRGNEQAWRDHL